MFRPTGPEIGGAICAFLGIFLSFSVGSTITNGTVRETTRTLDGRIVETTTTVHGAVVHALHTDYGKVLFGVLAVILAAGAILSIRRSRILPVGSIGLHNALAVVIACVGAYDIAVGFALV